MLIVISTMQAAQAFEAALSAKRTVAAAFSTALAVADEALTLAEAHEARISVLEAKLERLHNLATLRDPIAIFRGIIAARLGFSGWDALSNALMLESFWPNGPQRATQQLEAFLKSEGLSLAVWNGVRAVADAGVQAFHQGKGLAPALVLQMVRNGEVVPPDLASQRPSVEQMLVYLHKIKRK